MEERIKKYSIDTTVKGKFKLKNVIVIDEYIKILNKNRDELKRFCVVFFKEHFDMLIYFSGYYIKSFKNVPSDVVNKTLQQMVYAESTNRYPGFSEVESLANIGLSIVDPVLVKYDRVNTILRQQNCPSLDFHVS